MGRALIIGCGGVAGVVIHKCCQNSDVFEEIMIASRTKSKCDAIKEKLDGTTATTNAGGINGGLTNGNELVVRAAVKPTPSIGREQMTYNLATNKVEPLMIRGRHDVCVALRGAVVVEAAVAIALANFIR